MADNLWQGQNCRDALYAILKEPAEAYAQLPAGLFQAEEGVAAAATEVVSRASADFPLLRVFPDVTFRKVVRQRNFGMVILIGTPSVTASESLGQLLNEQGVDCQILNALFHEQEAEIVSQAGQPGRITIATNMAGRGTDIHLHDEVQACGGLHVIATEMHTNRRIDRQLIGRAARQGDPGSYQFWLSLEDELFRYLPGKQQKSLRAKARPAVTGELSIDWRRIFRRTQRQIENRERKHRRELLQQEQMREKNCKSMGLDPYLEIAE